MSRKWSAYMDHLASPVLRRVAERSYTLISTPDELRALFSTFGFKHHVGHTTDLWSDRWTHDSPQGRTTLVLFPSGRLSLLGPQISQVEDRKSTRLNSSHV